MTAALDLSLGERWVMSRDDPGSQHRQSTWLARAHDASLPLWLRVAALAFGCHEANGHAKFPTGYLVAVLSKSSAEVSRAIASAKAKGWIDKASNARCLVVPPDKVAGGIGHQHNSCSVHGGRLTKRQKEALRAKEWPGN
jgi:hypothetical protein